MQFAKQKNLDHQNRPTIKIEDGSQVTRDDIVISLRRALTEFSSFQADDGHWPGGYTGVLFILPLLVLNPSRK